MFVLALSAALAAPARAMTPETEAFVRKAGLDPASAAVRTADAEGPINTVYQGDEKEYSLDSLAHDGAKNGLKAFVSTREFIRKLKANFAGTPIPTSGYDGLYLTIEERKLALKKVFG
jgi:hypothetical protein